ncbi:glycosyltransferase family 2 protein [bacterium]|nr:glycosyltransferase family 2 protein [bacterium]
MPEPVDIIIPHLRGQKLFMRCLETLFKTDYPDFRVILVDNGSIDGSVAAAKNAFPEIIVIRLDENLGFAGGCNAGVNYSGRELIALLNDDTEVDPGWLKLLVDALLKDDCIAVVQPKLRWLLDRSKFDYAGGVGGMLDIFGFPFCYGRMFETMETDEGQYDGVRDIFWASGSALLTRRSLFMQAGGLDERYFAHQEEIDLNWRLQLMGYKITAVPQALVYHYAGGTLSSADFNKKYFNHRNSVYTLLKNYQLRNLLWILPIRLILEIMAAVLAVKQGDFLRILAIFRAGFWNIFHLPLLLKARRQVKRLRIKSDREIMRRLYQGSIALQYYLFGKRYTSQALPAAVPYHKCETPSKVQINR